MPGIRRRGVGAAGSHHIAVVSLPGGVGRTTVAACLGLVLAELRSDRVVVLDANPDAGTLGERLTPGTSATVRDLLDGIGSVRSVSDLARYAGLAGRLQVLAADQDPTAAEAFDRAGYERVALVLARFCDIVITDCGPGLVHPATRGALAVADALVVVGTPTVDGASRVGRALDRLEAQGYAELVADAVVVLSGHRVSAEVDRSRIRRHFEARCRAVVELPFDPHLATGGPIERIRLRPATDAAFRTLAASVADGPAAAGEPRVEGRRPSTAPTSDREVVRRDAPRRGHRVTAGGALIGVLLAAGTGIAAFLGAGGGPSRPDPDAVLVSGSGERYVVVDGRLRPTLNLASALLVGGGPVGPLRPAVLDEIPRGLPVGIPDAPDALPPAARLSAAPWTVCVAPAAPAAPAGAAPADAPDAPVEVTVRVAGPEPDAGRVGPAEAVLVTGPDGTPWLVHQGRRLRLADEVTRALLGAGATPPAVPAEILDLLPEGPPIVVPPIDDPNVPVAGLPSSWLVADVVRVRAGDGGAQSFAVLSDGLSPVSELVAGLMVAAGSAEATTEPATARTARRSAAAPLGSPGWPEVVPRLVGPQPGGPLCLSTTPGDPARVVRASLPAAVPASAGQPVPPAGGPAPGTADRVVVPRGDGALVRATSAGGDEVLTLVTDSGRRFAVPTPDAAVRLGYDPAAAPALAAPFVRLLPAGPVLDPAAARRTAER